MRHLRAIVRASELILWTLLMYAALVLGLPFLFVFKTSRSRWRSIVFHRWAMVMAIILGLKIDVTGEPPRQPFLLVSNHLSYLDVLLFASQMKCVFVARGDLAQWPLVGALCRAAGTIFINRQSRMDVARVNGLISQALDDGRGVVLFAEATSSRGETVLPFKSSLLEQAARASFAVSYAAITYRTRASEPAPDVSVCWWGGMTFTRHLTGLLYLTEVQGDVVFGEEPICASDRKVLAQRLSSAVREHFIPVVQTPGILAPNNGRAQLDVERRAEVSGRV
jgi:1-acyl-sn-glycerol-3-phosphate acyltransferase